MIVDTSAWIYLFDRRRTDGSLKAKKFYEANKSPLVVTDLIIEETHKWLVHHAFPPKEALNILDHFTAEDFAHILTIEEKDCLEACKLVHKYLDQKLSYTDAITVVLMKRLNIKKVFSFDHHFDLFKGLERVS